MRIRRRQSLSFLHRAEQTFFIMICPRHMHLDTFNPQEQDRRLQSEGLVNRGLLGYSDASFSLSLFVCSIYISSVLMKLRLS
jgi:hypothetical protein